MLRLRLTEKTKNEASNEPRDNYPRFVTFGPRTPFGYFASTDENGEKAFEADYEVLAVLSEMFDLIDNGQTFRQVSEVLKGRGYNLSRAGLNNLMRKYRPDSPVIQHFNKLIKDRKGRPKKQPKALSKAEKEALKTKYKIAGEKRRITNARKRIENLTQDKKIFEEKVEAVKEALVAPVVITTSLVDIEEVANERDVVFKPNDGPQTEFLAATELEVLYGGAAGGGKSFALIADPMRYFNEPNFNGLIIRRTNDELREMIWNTKKLYPEAFHKAHFSEKSSEWRFPSGARIWISYLDRDDDVLRYQGQAFTWIGFDELTQYSTPFAWDYLRSRLRTADPKLKDSLSMRATTNPGGPGHGWVKKMFIDPAPYNTPFWATNIDTGQTLIDPETGLPLFKRRFIPARLSDNPFLAKDGMYRTNLLSLSDGKKAQLLDGDWTIADGAAFPEFRVSKHVCEPFDIPSSWTKFRAADWGYSSHTCVLWFAIDPTDNQLVVFKEMYVSKMTAEQLAFEINLFERDCKVQYGVLDSSVWHKRNEGPSIAEVMLMKNCRWRPSDRSAGSRVAGKNRIHELLKDNEFTNRPGIIFFNNCRQIISDLQVIPTDPDGSDDIDSRYPSDHSYDALRYGVMSRPKDLSWWQEGESKAMNLRPADIRFGY